MFTVLSIFGIELPAYLHILTGISVALLSTAPVFFFGNDTDNSFAKKK